MQVELKILIRGDLTNLITKPDNLHRCWVFLCHNKNGSISLCRGFRPFPETDYNFTNLLNRIDDATLSLFEPHLTIRLTYTQVNNGKVVCSLVGGRGQTLLLTFLTANLITAI